jgi:hypothetical protein
LQARHVIRDLTIEITRAVAARETPEGALGYRSERRLALPHTLIEFNIHRRTGKIA